jgi:septal ring factor EnvC (AmiA/AmiB activator)
VLRHNLSEKNDLLSEVSNYTAQIAGSEKVIRIILLKENVTAERLLRLKKELRVLKKEVEVAKKQYQKILLEEYKYRGYKTKLMFLVSSKSINQFLSRLRQLERLKLYRVRHLNAVKNKKTDLANRIAIYEGTEEEKQEMVAREQEERSRLKILIEEKRALLKDLAIENNMLQVRLNESLTSINAIQKRISSEIIKDVDNERENGKPELRLDWPVENGLIVGQFGVQNHTTVHKIRVENNGIDILVPKGESVHCVMPGKVKASFEIPGSNATIIIDHGNYFSVYTNVQDLQVGVGDEVSRGTQLATIARNDEDLFKLHFELWLGRKKLNPEEFLIGR